MPLNFPTTPTVDQIYNYNGTAYRWTGSKWKRVDTTTPAVTTEYTNKIAISGTNTVNIDPSKYNYYKIAVDSNISIILPNSASVYSDFVLELNYTPDIQGWNLATASYTNNFTYVGSQDVDPFGLFFKPDGTKMYVVGYNNDRVYEYNLSTAWSVSTAVYSGSFASVGSQDVDPRGVFFKPDGTKMYVVGWTNDRVYEYNLSTAWAVSTAVYSRSFASVGSQEANPYGLFFKPDGTKMYVSGYGNKRVFEYNLSTAWSVSTAVYSGNSFYVGSQDADPTGLFFKPDGTKMYVVGWTNKRVFEYNLSTAWSVATAVYSGSFASVGSQDVNPAGLFFKPDGTKMYVVGYNNKRVYEYNTLNITTRTITWSSNISWAGGSAPTLNYTYASNILIHFTTYDGYTWVANPLSLDSRSS